MKTLKFLTVAFLAVGLLVAINSCEKINEKNTVEVSFTLNNPAFSMDKKDGVADNQLPECPIDDPDYVWVNISDDGVAANAKWYLLSVVLDNQTAVIKFILGEDVNTHQYTIHDFLVFAGTPPTGATSPDLTSENLIWAAPGISSKYIAEMNWGITGLPKTFDVDAFTKKKVDVDVLCYQTAEFKNFGFSWFDYNRIKIKNICFFGDIYCDPYDWEWHNALHFIDDGGVLHDITGEYYNGQLSYDYDPATGIGDWDFPAIFRTRITNGAGYDQTFDNEDWFGEGEPLCVEFIDDLSKIESYTIEISILVSNPILRCVLYSDVVYRGTLAQTTMDGAFTLTADYVSPLAYFNNEDATDENSDFFDEDLGNLDVWSFVWECRDIPQGEEGCETAFAKFEKDATDYQGNLLYDTGTCPQTDNPECYADNLGLNTDRWGWAGILSAWPMTDVGAYDVIVTDLWAGAGNNNTANGVNVGTVTYSINTNGYLEVAYQLTGDFKLSQIHSYAKLEKPDKVAPGSYNYNQEGLYPDQTHAFTTDIAVGDILETSPLYLISHAVVVGPETNGIFDDFEEDCILEIDD